MQRIKECEKSILEILYLIKMCITNFWFWVPILFYGYIFLQLWMLFYVNPLTILAMPIVILIYGYLSTKRSLKHNKMKKESSRLGLKENKKGK